MAEFGDEIDELFGDGMTTTATGLGVANLDEDPEAAATALRLQRYTGVPADVIHGDLEGFQANHKAELVSQMLRDNKHLAGYVARFPMAAKVSNDDYPELNDLSKVLQSAKSGAIGSLDKIIKDIAPDTIDVAKQALEGLRDAPGRILGLGKPEGSEEVAKQIEEWAASHGQDPTQVQRTIDTVLNRMQRGQGIQDALFGIPTLLASPLFGAFRTYISRPIEESGGLPKEATEQLAVAAAAAFGLGHQLRATTAKIKQIEPYAKAGEIPPPGVFPELDPMHVERAKADAKELDDQIKAAGKSKTIERSVDAGEDFIRGHVGDKEIGLSAEKALELYGDKIPEPDDGILGWVPDIAKQLEVARETGADIKVPLAGWLARPEFAKELTDFVRLRAEGMTKEEADNFEPPKEGEVIEPKKFTKDEQDPLEQQIQRKNAERLIARGNLTPEELDYIKSEFPDLVGATKEESDAAYKRISKSPITIEGVPHEPLAMAEDGGPKMSRRGFLKGAGAVAATAATEKIPGVGKLVEAATPDTLGKMAETKAAEVWKFLDTGGSFEKGIGSGFRDIVAEELESLIKPTDVPDHNQLVLKAALERIKSGWTPSRELLNSLSKVGPGEGIEPSEMTRKMTEEGLPEEVAGQTMLPEPTDYMKSGYPEGIVESGVRGRLAQLEEPQSPIDLVRREGAFEPPMMVGKPDLKLKHVGTKDADGITFDSFELRRGRKAVGSIDLHLRPNGLMIIGNIEGYEGGGPNAFGYHTIKALFEQIKAEYPEMKRMGGYRITGAREKATKDQGVDKLGWTEIPLTHVEDFHEFLNKITGWDRVEPEPAPEPKPGTFFAKYKGATLEMRPTALFTEKEAEIHDAVRHIIRQIAPGASFLAPDRINVKGTGGSGKVAPAGGVYYPAHWTESGNAVIMAVMSDANATHGTLGIALHEAIHHLRTGYFTPEEWSTLEKAAVDGNWVKRYNVDINYPTGANWLQLEEAIAQGYRHWAQEKFLPDSIAPKEARAVFERIKELFDKIRDRLYEIFGRKLTADELFTRVSAGEIGSREPTEFGKDRFTTLPKTMAEDFEKATSLEEQEMFAKGAAIGMTQVQFKKYLKLIEERREADEARAKARADRATQVTKTEQWKENEPRVREEVTNEINSRPDVVADEFFRRGMLNGEKIKRQYLGAEYLTAEQAKAIGSDVIHKNGINPVDVAGLFGFVSPEHMLEAMTKLNEARNESGLGPKPFKDRMIRERTQAQMMKRYGVPEYDALLKEIREDIVSDTQMDMLHEETVALATNAGQAPPVSKGQVKSWVSQRFSESRVGTVKDMAMWIREAGKAGRAAELSLLKGDALDAFKQKQRQYISALFAAEAKKLGKEMDRADRTFKDLSTHNTKAGVDQEYLDQLHRVMDQIGRGNKRNPGELASALAGKPLEDFVNAKVGDLREMPVADFLFDPAYRKDVKDMTVDEFRAVRDSVKTMLHNARDEQKLWDIDKKAELTALTVEARDQASKISRQYEPRNPGAISRLKSVGYKFDAALLKMEQLMDWLDREDPNGVFNRVVFRRIEDAKHAENDLRKEIGAKLKEIPTKGIKWDRGVEHEEISDWKNGDPVNFTERDMIGLMLNVGNESNFDKLTSTFKFEGHEYTLERDTILHLIEKNARKEHWDFVQGTWDTFEHLWPRIEKLSRDMSGLAPDRVDAREINTPFGKYRGGYYPLIADHRWEGPGPSRARGIFGEDKYTRAIPPRGYTKSRTKVAYPLELDPNISSQKLMETVHDLAYREALVDAKKFLEHPEVRRAIRNALGPEYLNQVRPWLENVANPAAMRAVSNEALSGINTVARVARERLVAVQLMYRASTIMKHSIAAALDSVGEVGLREFSGEMAHFYAQPWKTRERIDFVMEKSGELRNRIHDIDRDIGEMMDRNLGSNGLYASAMHYGAIGVSTLDIGTAIPTWSLAYKRALMKGASEADAVFIGDKAVRAAHGSTGVPDLPAIMRGPDVLRLFTIAYGFFNHNYNRIRNIGRLLGKEGVAGDLASGDVSGAWVKFQRAAWMSTWYIVLMAAVEEAVSPAPGTDKESWGHYVGKGIFHQLSSTVPFVRDMAGYWLGRSRPTDPISQIGEAVFKPLADLKRWHDGKKTTNVVRHLFESAGYALAIPGMGQAGVTAQYLTDLRSGRQRADSWFLGKGLGTNVIPFGASTHARGLTLGRSDPHKKLR